MLARGICPVLVIATGALGCPDAVPSRSVEVAGVPTESQWTYRGRVLLPGSPGEWDHRIDGSMTPSTVVRKDGRLFLYYVGATGNRYDRGPANRSLGVATSTDGLQFTKYSENPVIRHQPDGGHDNVVEEGVFSAGATLDSDGTVVMYFGGMQSVGSTSVDGDGLLATSSDGFNFIVHGDVIDHRNPSVYRYGDEIFPVGAYRHADGRWSSYYIGKGKGGIWDLGLATGPARDDFTSHVEALDVRNELRSGGDPISLPTGELLVPVGRYPRKTATIELRATAPDALHDLSAIAARYDFGDVVEFTMYLDHELGQWLLFYVTPAADGIHLRTAPVHLN